MDIQEIYRWQSIAIEQVKTTIADLKKMDAEIKIRALPVGIPDTIYLDLARRLTGSVIWLERVLCDVDPQTFNQPENSDECERWHEANPKFPKF